MTIDLAADWLAQMKHTMAVDVSRGIRANRSPMLIVDMLFDIPEVAEAMHMRVPVLATAADEPRHA